MYSTIRKEIQNECKLKSSNTVRNLYTKPTPTHKAEDRLKRAEFNRTSKIEMLSTVKKGITINLDSNPTPTLKRQYTNQSQFDLQIPHSLKQVVTTKHISSRVSSQTRSDYSPVFR